MILTSIRQTTPIGIDLGSAMSRAVQLTRAGERWRLTAALSCEADSGGEADRGHLDMGRIGHLASRSCLRGRSACVAVSSPEVHFHLLELPSSALTADIAGGTRSTPLVQNEMERLTGGVLSPAETRHWTLPGAAANSPNAIGVALARPVAETIVYSGERGGLRCDRLTTAPTALVAAACYLGRPPEGHVWGILDVGLRESRLILCAGQMPVLVRRAGSGGRIMTERVAQALGLSTKAAEVHKCDHGIAAPSCREMRDESRRSELPSLIIGALRSELTEIAAEIKRSYEYVLRCFPGRTAGDLILAGSGGMMKNLPAFFSQALGIAVRPASSYLGSSDCRLEIQEGLRAPIEAFAVAIGAALEAADVA